MQFLHRLAMSIKEIALDYPEALPALSRGRGRDGRNSLQGGLDQIANGPDAIRDPERHGRRHAQRLMRPTQIVERDVKAHGGKVAIDLFREAVAEPCEAL